MVWGAQMTQVCVGVMEELLDEWLGTQPEDRGSLSAVDDGRPGL